MRAPTDTELVSAARTGDETAYGALFERYQLRVYNYAYSIVGNPEEASDVAQEAFLRVFQAIPGKSDDLNFSAYVYRTAHNVAVDGARARMQFVGPDALDLAHEPALRANPEKVALLKEQQERTWRAAFELPDKQREILTLREIHDMSYQEIADVLELSRNTVGVLLSRARLKFKEAFRMSSIDVETLAEQCRGILPLLSARIDGELAGDEHARVEEHLESCAFCRLALEEMTEASASLRGVVPLLPPVALGHHVRSGIANLASPEKAYGAELGAHTRVATRGRAWWTHGSAIAAGVLVAVATLAGMAAWSSSAGDSKVSAGSTPPGATKWSFPLRVPDATATEEAIKPIVPVHEHAADKPKADTAGSASAGGDTKAPPTPLQRFPGDGATITKKNVTLTWSSVEDSSGVTYVVEVQTWSPGAQAYLTGVAEKVDSTSYARTSTASTERWRVRAVDGAGNQSAFSGWNTYKISTVSITPRIMVQGIGE